MPKLVKPSFYESEYNMYYEDGMFPNPELMEFAPDIIYVDQLMATNLAENGHIIPLTQICGNFTVDGLTAFWYDRDTYAVPSTTCFQCMYINKGIFDKNKKLLDKFSMDTVIRNINNEKRNIFNVKVYFTPDSRIQIIRYL